MNHPVRIKHIWYFLIVTYGLGLVGITRAVARWVGDRFVKANKIVPMEWLEDFFFQPEKFPELMVFVAISAALFLYLLAIALGGRCLMRLSLLRHALGFRNGSWRFVYILLSLAFNTIVVVKTSASIGMLATQVYCWLILAGMAWAPLQNSAQVEEPKKKKGARAEKILIILCVSHFFLILAPFCLGELKVANEFLDIPEKTLMRMPGKEPYYVDNISFINQHNLFGFHHKYDLTQPQPQRQPVSWEAGRGNLALQLKLGQKEFTATAQYSPAQGSVTLVQPFSDAQLGMLLGMSLTAAAKDSLLAANSLATVEQAKLHQKNTTAEEKLFIKNNAFEIHWQILNRWFIHHHNFILNPIQEYSLGKDPGQIFSQYIWLPIMLLKEVLETVGTVSYQDYVKVWYFIYLIYFILYVLLFWLVFKDRRYLLGFLLLLLVSINISEYTFFYLAPGWNPIRHFFDIAVFYAFFRFAITGRLPWLAGAYFFIALSILFNWQFGFFLLISLTGATLVNKLLTVPFGRLLCDRTVQLSATMALCLLPLLFYARFGEDGFAMYHLLGLVGFPSSYWSRALLIGLYSTGWFLLFRKKSIQEPWRSICFFSLGYSFLSIIYYIRSPIYYHITSMVWVHALTIFSFMRGLNRTFIHWGKYERAMTGWMTVVLLIAYLPTTGFYYYTKYKFDQVFETHQVYQWDFPKARFLSTMDPAYFRDSAALLERYEKGNNVFILSKYDSLLPFLSNKYSAMPYPDLTQFLITSREIEMSVQRIATGRPEYLFLDKDIDRPLIVDVVNKDAASGIQHLHLESVWRVQRIGLLRKIYERVRDEYESVPVESSHLLSVYRRKK